MNKYCGEDPCIGTQNGDCRESIDSRCVVYNLRDETPSQLMCFLNISNKTSVHTILEQLDEKLCDLLSVTLLPCFRELIDIGPTEDLTVTDFLYHLQEYLCNSSDEKVKVSANDPQAGYLFDKITSGECVTKSVKVDPVTQYRSIHIEIDWECAAGKITPHIILPNCYEIDCTPCEGSEGCTPKPLIPVIIKNITDSGAVVLSCTSCNGIISWYNENDEVVGYGESVIVNAGTYYAKSQTVCGVSEASNTIEVPEYQSYTYTKKVSFTKNNCPDNGCGLPCMGSSVLFSKTYTSYISLDHAKQLANTDTSFDTEGQNFANLNGVCECPSCDCIKPMAGNFVVTNPTCNGEVLNANGSVAITGISNANKFGISYTQGGYAGPDYSSAYTMGYNSGSMASTATSITLTSLSSPRVIVRVFNGENACFTDLLFSLTIPDCQSGEGEVIVGNVTVSCSI